MAAEHDGFPLTMEELLAGLRAAAESTRLRVLALCARAELSVTELVTILGQSQPRVSRHLKVLAESGLLERLPEGNWVFFRLADQHPLGATLRALLVDLSAREPVLALDQQRLESVKRSRAARAADYFSANAARWDEIRSLHVDEAQVENAVIAIIRDEMPPDGIEEYLDIGTGTGRFLELLSQHVDRANGIDLSRDMLSIARTNVERAGLVNCHVRYGDMYHLPWPADSFDLLTIHQVLHFADAPGEVIAEAARVLRPGGRLVVVDFAPHTLEYLRQDHAHRRLGFSDRELAQWCTAAGLKALRFHHLAGDPLTVTILGAARPDRRLPMASKTPATADFEGSRA
ncbi:MAG: metalloregulator ArsR/SmtB family transcription factor [Alphaproteobacteria bacterium]